MLEHRDDDYDHDVVVVSTRELVFVWLLGDAFRATNLSPRPSFVVSTMMMMIEQYEAVTQP